MGAVKCVPRKGGRALWERNFTERGPARSIKCSESLDRTVCFPLERTEVQKFCVWTQNLHALPPCVLPKEPSSLPNPFRYTHSPSSLPIDRVPCLLPVCFHARIPISYTPVLQKNNPHQTKTRSRPRQTQRNKQASATPAATLIKDRSSSPAPQNPPHELPHPLLHRIPLLLPRGSPPRLPLPLLAASAAGLSFL